MFFAISIIHFTIDEKNIKGICNTTFKLKGTTVERRKLWITSCSENNLFSFLIPYSPRGIFFSKVDGFAKLGIWIESNPYKVLFILAEEK